MKNYIFLCSFLAFALTAASQTNFGIKGGINLTIFNENQEQFGENPETEFGYFGGVFLDITLTEKFHLQPELLYKGVGDFQFLNAPLYVEYYVAEDFSILLGPSLNYFFDAFVNKFKVRGDVAAAYHFNETFELNLKYSQSFRVLSPNIIFLGVGVTL